MTSGLDDYWDRKIRQNNIPEEFGGVTGKKYEQMEFDFGEDPFAFLSDSDEVLNQKAETHKRDMWKLRDEVGNKILQAKAIVGLTMDSMGNNIGSSTDDYEFALWGASELLQNAMDLLE